jgi:general stress protein YciG
VCVPQINFDGSEAKSSHPSDTSNNNYARPGGQNTGNFMTDRNSSRVLQAPGGASTICFGNEKSASEQEAWLPSGRRGGAQQSNSSQINF